MLSVGQTLSLEVEKPAVGGRMIARADGQIVLVDGAIPGERVAVVIDRVERKVAYGRTVAVEASSPDRHQEVADRRCGGCLYAHIAYGRQLALKAAIVGDAFARIARLPLGRLPPVLPSPAAGYRMRARLHCRGGRIGFFREQTHELCDVRPTGQLLPATCDVLDALRASLTESWAQSVHQIEVSENLAATERAVHLDQLSEPRKVEASASWARSLLTAGVTGLSTGGAAPGTVRVLGGSPYVSDIFDVAGRPVVIRRHVSSFFQGNRFLLRPLVTHVATLIPDGSRLVDLYAGGGLFALAAAAPASAVTAVEGDRVAAADLVANVKAAGAKVRVVHQAVEDFARSAPPGTDVALLDPPRTGLSQDALHGTLRLSARRLVYVSCAVATLARDARRLVDAGYAIGSVEAFDMFPNTPHVETVVVFEK
jgi:23S rRNA (uracil1939-C5)-methyltransferase